MSRDVESVTPVTPVRTGKVPPVGSILLGKYRVEATLGAGAMGLVIRALNTALGESVAIKLMRSDVQIDTEHVERFIREAKAAVRLMSEHVAKIRDVGMLEDGRPYIIMELLEGDDLGKLLIDDGAIVRPRAVDFVLQACDAIAEAHALGIVHRDIKPTNLFVTRRHDGTELLKVLDFGISKAQSGPELSLTQTSSMLGTPAYMSPEQMRSARSVDPRSDIWALGTVLYEIVEGRLPFAADSFAELCVAVATEQPRPLLRAPELSPVVSRCLTKSLPERFQDVGELAVALEPFASDPRRAARQVRRILRVLGTNQPAAEDGPLPPTRMMRGPRLVSDVELPPTRISRGVTSPAALPVADDLPPARAPRALTPPQGVQHDELPPTRSARSSTPPPYAASDDLPPTRSARPSASPLTVASGEIAAPRKSDASYSQPSDTIRDGIPAARKTDPSYAQAADTIRDGVPAITGDLPPTGPAHSGVPQLGAVLRESVPIVAASTRDSGAAIAAPSPSLRTDRIASVSSRDTSIPWRPIVVLVVLFAIGIAAGLYVTSRGGSNDEHAGRVIQMTPVDASQ